MQEFDGFRTLETISQNPKTVVYRAVRESDQTPVILKTLSSEVVSLRAVARYRYSFSITKELAHENICKTYSLQEETRHPVLVMEDIKGQGLQELMRSGTLPIETVLSIALKITDAMIYLHGNNIVHKDIKPANIVYNAETQQVQLIDFLLSSKAVGEHTGWSEPGQLEGTIAYISPEQTGRMNRQIDHRSDLYSMGVTLYELLTGQVPFPQTDLLALIHAHLAIPPVPPHKVNDSIHELLSLIVMKLLEKTPEQRYQSAYGLKADLEEYFEKLRSSKPIRSFPLASKDIFPHLQMSQSIYGREKEVEALLGAFENVHGGAAELFLIGGYSGIGKTALAQELSGPVTARHGRLIQRKYDALQSTPHEGLIQALSQLVREVISFPKTKFHDWKRKIQNALGQVGMVLVDLIPELTSVVGEQPPLPPSSSAEAQKRFHRVIQRLLQVFASKDQPLVLFVDDLQWATASSTQLLFQMIKSGEMNHILIIGTYRDNEVTEAHPLHSQIQEMREHGRDFTEVTLEPLSEAAINHWIADSLSLSEKRTEFLTSEIYHKTQGSPFFTERFLRALHEENCLWFAPNSNQWKWDIQSIQSTDFTENVTDLMAYELKKLPASCLEILQWAACSGTLFDIKTLSELTHSSMADLAQQLLPALQEGFVQPVGTSYRLATLNLQELAGSDNIDIKYRFVHDKLREEVLSLLDDLTRQEYHFQLGQHFLDQSDLETEPEKVIDIVNQWRHCLSHFTSRAERQRVAELHLLAGQRAMKAIAYQKALRFATIACDILSDEAWKEIHPLAYSASMLQAESAQMLGAFELAIEAEERAEVYAETLEEKIQIHEQRLNRAISTTDIPKIKASCQDIFSLFGDDIKDAEIVAEKSAQEWARIDTLLEQYSMEDLEHRPKLDDPNIALQVRAFARVSYLFEWVPALQQLALGRTIRLSIEHGNSIESPFAYMTYAIALATQEKYKEAREFGLLAIRINEQMKDTQSPRRASLEQMYGPFIHHWFEPIEEISGYIQRAVQLGLEHGNLEAAAFSTLNRLWVAIAQGLPLDQLLQEEQSVLQKMLSLNFPSVVPIIAGVIHSTCLLAGRPEVGESFNQQGMLEEVILEQLNQFFAAGARELEFRRTERFLLLEEYEKALVSAKNGASLLGYALPTIPLFTWHYSILLATLYEDASPQEQKEYKTLLAEHLKRFNHWSECSASNTIHFTRHVEAEMAMIEGEFDRAEKLFEEAYQHAKKHKRLNAEGLILERTAKLFERQGKARFVRAYLVDAYNTYANWQAKAKTALMEKRYPYLNAHRTKHTFLQSTSTHSETNTTGSHNSNVLDLHSILKANQVIAEEISLDKLLQKSMAVVVENAGAESGLLLLPGKDGLRIEAMLPGGNQEISVLESLLPTSELLATSVVYYVERTRERVVLDCAWKAPEFSNDEYIVQQTTQSLLCSPLLQNQQLVGILYLENNQAEQVFNTDRCAVLDMLSAQIAGSIENARLYTSLEEKVIERTSELRQAKEQLEHTFLNLESKHRELQEAQVQLVQSEKMASLGTLVAGVAHEINNPCNWSHNGTQLLKHRLKDLHAFLLDLADVENNPEIEELFSRKFDPIFSTIGSVLDGTSQIKSIVEGLRTFSRLDEAEYKQANIVENLRASLSLIQANFHKEVDFLCEFAFEPEFECLPAQLNQAFMNIMINSIQAIRDQRKQDGLEQKGTLKIRTFQSGEDLGIQFQDDGCGMSEKVKDRIFEPFFTTHQVGDGTGLGMSITFGIIKKHNGNIEVTSQPGEGTTVTVTLPQKSQVYGK